MEGSVQCCSSQSPALVCLQRSDGPYALVLVPTREVGGFSFLSLMNTDVWAWGCGSTRVPHLRKHCQSFCSGLALIKSVIFVQGQPGVSQFSSCSWESLWRLQNLCGSVQASCLTHAGGMSKTNEFSFAKCVGLYKCFIFKAFFQFHK